MKSMGATQEEYYRGVRMVPYDLVKELVLALAGVGILAVAVSAILSSPDVAPITIAAWAQSDPVDFVTTATNELAGSTTSAEYGNPYNTNGSGQAWGPIAPQTWFGTRIPIDSAATFVIEPLSGIHPRSTTPEKQVASTIKGTLLTQKKNQAITDWFNNLSKSFCSGGKIKYQVGYKPSPDPCASTTSTNTST